jgi:UDP-N-acetylglucosamine acyltransferase
MTDIHETAVIEDGAELAEDVSVGPYSVISSKTTIGSGTEIGTRVTTEGPVEIGSGNQIGTGAVIGTKPQDWSYDGEETGVVIGDDNVIREYATVNRSSSGPDGDTVIGDENMIMTYCHVAHDCEIGDDVSMANGVTLAGHVTVEDHVMMGGLTPVHQFVRIGAYSMVGGLSRINKDVPPFIRISGNPAQVYDVNAIGLKRNGIDSEGRKNIKKAFRLIYRENYNTSQALEKIRGSEELEGETHVQHLVEFIEESERGIHK